MRFWEPERSGIGVVDLGMMAMAKFCQNHARGPASVPIRKNFLPRLFTMIFVPSGNTARLL